MIIPVLLNSLKVRLRHINDTKLDLRSMRLLELEKSYITRFV